MEWHCQQVEPLSDEPLSGLPCTSIMPKHTQQLDGAYAPVEVGDAAVAAVAVAAPDTPASLP